MKSIKFVVNEKTAIQIDSKSIDRNRNAIEELLDGIIAESRKKEVKVPLSKVINNLKKSGKL